MMGRRSHDAIQQMDPSRTRVVRRLPDMKEARQRLAQGGVRGVKWDGRAGVAAGYIESVWVWADGRG